MKTTQPIQISIPKPCSEDWNRMTKKEKGRHCNSCNTTVVDFTRMSDEEIKNYFIELKNTKTCGRFYAGQLQSDKNRYEKILLDLHKKAESEIRFRPLRHVALLVLGSLLTLTSCIGKAIPDEKLVGEVEMIPDTVIAHPINSMAKDSVGTIEK